MDNITARVANRTDEDRRPEFAAILTAVENFRPVLDEPSNSALSRFKRLSIGTIRHQKLKLLPSTSFRS